MSPRRGSTPRLTDRQSLCDFDFDSGQAQTEKRDTENTPRRETEERNRREIKDADQGRSKKQVQRRTMTAPRHDVRGSEYIVKRDCSDD
jgi:hypothetical protein